MMCEPAGSVICWLPFAMTEGWSVEMARDLALAPTTERQAAATAIAMEYLAGRMKPPKVNAPQLWDPLPPGPARTDNNLPSPQASSRTRGEVKFAASRGAATKQNTKAID
jgi:hypothetical protein